MAAPSMRIKRDTAELSRVRRRVAVWAADAGLGDRATRRLQLAVDEIVANAIEHGLRPRGHAVVAVTGSARGITVTVRYRGSAFDPTTAPTVTQQAALRDRASHGYGLHLIRTLVDNVTYRRDGDVNEVQLTAES